MTEKPVLEIYDPKKRTMVSADASSYGLGAVLKQCQSDGKYKPIAFASRTLTPAERRYAQIEKEALALTWACERFRDFIIGLQVLLETDHKPLVPILKTKNLDDLTPRLQRFRLRLMRYRYEIIHTAGKNLITADALSRSPLKGTEDGEIQEEVSAYVSLVISSLPATDDKLQQIWTAQQEDGLLQKLAEYSLGGWPEKSNLEKELEPYYSSKDEISVIDGLLMRDSRLIIPKKLRQNILELIHRGHQGITKCRARARESVWWPKISDDIEETIRRCTICTKELKERHEPLMPSDFPERPWQKVGMDLFYLKNDWYLVVSDYYSRYPEVVKLSSMTAEVIVNHCKSLFARHGVPEEVRSDNGPQFKKLNTSLFTKFALDYGFRHVTSSPRFSQSNGFVESAVKIVKNLLKKNDDPYVGLMEYRATPLSNGYSPAELLMGRRIRTVLPMSPIKLKPGLVAERKLQEKEGRRIEKQKENYDNRHGVREKSEFQKGQTVWIKDLRTWGRIKEKASSPRSYIVETDRGDFRRNSFHLTVASGFRYESNDKEVEDSPAVETPADSGALHPYHTRSGRMVKEPRRLNL